jgi:hypothetical protein
VIPVIAQGESPNSSAFLVPIVLAHGTQVTCLEFRSFGLRRQFVRQFTFTLVAVDALLGFDNLSFIWNYVDGGSLHGRDVLPCLSWLVSLNPVVDVECRCKISKQAFALTCWFARIMLKANTASSPMSSFRN